MIYEYTCYDCGEKYEIHQTMHEEHSYRCPACGKTCSRVFSLAKPKLNRGFFSATLGREVKSHTDFEQGLRECRYMNYRKERYGDNSTPKDEWVEKRAVALERERQDSQQAINNGKA